MSLTDRLRGGTTPGPPDVRAPVPEVQTFHDLKGSLHRRIIDRLDLAALGKLPPERLRDELRQTLAALLANEEAALTRPERERMVDELIDELTGLGPLEAVLRDPTVSDILVNGYATTFVERRGKLEPAPLRFRDDDHLLQIINRIVSRVGRRVDETSPMVDARLADGSRVNAIIPPLALDGPSLSIRRFGSGTVSLATLIESGSLSREALGFLGAAVRARLNVVVSGGTGTGKTTMLNALSRFIPSDERVITIEDSAELRLEQRHVVRLETRPANLEGHGAIAARDLLKNSLRMRPDRIVVGEVRGGEVLDMLQAMNTGHEGSMTTLHANTPRDAVGRLEVMVGMSGVPMTEQAIRQMIARSIDLIVQLSRGSDGRRRVTSVTEMTGLKGATVTMQELFRFEQTGVDARGQVLGSFGSTGIRPKAMDRLGRAGLDPESLLRTLMGSAS